MLRSSLLRCLPAGAAARRARSLQARFPAPPVSRASSSFSSNTDAGGLAGGDADADADADIYRNHTFNRSQAKLATLPTLLQPRVVIYDGVCHLCHRGVKWLIKVDKHEKIKFCCLQSKTAEPYLQLCGVDREDVLKRFLFIEGPDAYYAGSTAALKIASYLPFPYSTLSALLVVPAPLRDAVYDYVAKRRYNWFGKEDECIIMKQDQELLQRFIDRDEMFGGGGGDGDSRFF